jgi:hypothetical protein
MRIDGAGAAATTNSYVRGRACRIDACPPCCVGYSKALSTPARK